MKYMTLNHNLLRFLSLSLILLLPAITHSSQNQIANGTLINDIIKDSTTTVKNKLDTNLKILSNKVKDTVNKIPATFPTSPADPCASGGSTQFVLNEPQYYEVKAKSLAEAFAKAKVEPNLVSATYVNFKHLPDNGYSDTTGKVKCVHLYVYLTKKLPQWINIKDLKCTSVEEEWDKYINRANNHEDGHIEYLKEALATAHTELIGVNAKKADIENAIKDKVVPKVKESNNKYHKDHGLVKPPKVDITCKKKSSIDFQLFDHKQGVECRGNVETGQRDCAHFSFNIDGIVSGKFDVQDNKIQPVDVWNFRCASIKDGGVFDSSPYVLDFSVNASDESQNGLVQLTYKLDDPTTGQISLSVTGKKSESSPPCDLVSRYFVGEVILRSGRSSSSRYWTSRGV